MVMHAGVTSITYNGGQRANDTLHQAQDQTISHHEPWRLIMHLYTVRVAVARYCRQLKCYLAINPPYAFVHGFKRLHLFAP